MGPDTSYIKEIIAKLGERFIISDLGPIQSYLGIDIKRSEDLKITTLLQKRNIEKVLKRFKMDQTNLIATPIETRFIRQKYN